MLEELYLNNIVIFEQAVMNFSSGLNVISGETGAGKSLVATAVGLALGARANAELLRSGADSASVSAVFSPLSSALISLLEMESGVTSAVDEGLIFERRLSRGRSSRLLLGGRPVTTATAQILADQLLDIAAQNEHTRLADSAYQRELLDSYGSIDVSAYRKVFTRAAGILRRINSGNSDLEKHRQELDRIEYRLEQIAKFAPDPDIDRNLEEQIELMTEAENIKIVAAEAAEYLYEGENAVVGRIAQILRNSGKYAGISSELAEATEILESAVVLLEDASRAYRDVAEDTEYSEEELDGMITRAEELKALARTLECDTVEDSSLFEGILAAQTELEKRQGELSLWEISTEELEEELQSMLPELLAQANSLSLARRSAGKKLSEVISKELKNLGMEHADFAVQFEPYIKDNAGIKEILSQATAEGFEEVSFLITPNPGEAPSSIADTASGGESSRAMLAIKSALAAVHAPDTLIFDEIDVGVGGRLGDVLGRKLYELSRGRQVIVITHLPQIAAYADTHLQVFKETRSGRTVAQVRELSAKERVEEIAQMINGKAASAITRKQAEEMLAKRG